MSEHMEQARTAAMADGAVLHYRLQRGTEKRARVIVLLHGLASNMTRWSEFAEQTALRDRHDIMRVDLRGHGESFTRGAIGMRRWCEDLITLLDGEQYDDAVIFGHSLGAQVALHLAGRHSGRVAGMVLIDPVFRAALRPVWRVAAFFTPFAWLAIWAVKLLNALGLRRRRIPQRDLRQLDEKMRREFLSQGKQDLMIQRYSSPWPDLEHFPTANYMQEYLELLKPTPPLSSIEAPTLVLLSKGITFTELDKMKAAASKLPNGELEILKAYHWPLTENPTEIREAIERWVRRRFE